MSSNENTVITVTHEQYIELKQLLKNAKIVNKKSRKNKNMITCTSSENINTDDKDKIKRVIDTILNNDYKEVKIPAVYEHSKKHNISFNSTVSGKIYENIINKHNINIKITLTYVRNFLKSVISNIKHKDNKPPKCFNLESIVKNLVDGTTKYMSQDEFYSYVADYLIVKSSQHYYYDYVASYIAMMRIHNITTPDFLTTAKLLQENLDKNNDNSPILDKKIFDIIVQNHEQLQSVMNYDRDFMFDYFGIKTLERSYLYKLHFTKFKIIERPQHMIMRVALGIHGDNITSAIETYELMSQKYFVHATPTLFNAGTKRPQMSSCFLQAVDDNIESIFDAVHDLALISKWAGGIGIHLSSLRSRDTIIRGTNGLASGIIPLCVLLDKLAKYINQGGKRNGSIACYLEPHHPDIFDFCDLRKNTGTDDNRARDLFLGLWVSSLFIERVKNDKMWSLMCPDECPGLNKVHSNEYVLLYEKYELEKRYVKQVKARDLWKHILKTQTETGFPYILYKDNANMKSNQKNLGTICSSNLCAEIIQYSDEHETAVCNLASLCLPMYVEDVEDVENVKDIENVDIVNKEKRKKIFNYKKLMSVCRVAVRNIDQIIDRNYYPNEKTNHSNKRHRPMGIGVQGLADVYNLMGYSFSSPEAYDLNNRIFETIYYACIDESKELARRFGKYSTFDGSPASLGQLQFHMWGISENSLLMGYNWKQLIEEVKKHGLRNSLLTAIMPTASTSQIMGNSECVEPYMSNIFKRATLAGEFIVVNKNLMRDLLRLNLWDEDMRKRIIIENGSIQNINIIPNKIKKIYETAFETKQMHLVKQSADRGKFIDQSQSLNLFLAEPNFDILTAALINSHDLGNKTGMYYYRSLPAINPINFGIDINDIKRLTGSDMVIGSYNIKHNKPEEKEEPVMCKWRPGMTAEDCISCGS